MATIHDLVLELDFAIARHEKEIREIIKKKSDLNPDTLLLLNLIRDFIPREWQTSN